VSHSRVRDEVVVIVGRNVDVVLCAEICELLRGLKSLVVVAEIVPLMWRIYRRTLVEESLHLFEVLWTEVRRQVHFLPPPTTHSEVVLIVSSALPIVHNLLVIGEEDLPLVLASHGASVVS
jgi:hypothetical protein